MADLRSYNREFVTEFINVYKSLPALWKIKSKEYSDRNKKNDAYEQMINKMKEVEPEATKEAVKKKVNSLRSSYRKELKKVEASRRSGAGTDDVYEPSLWYFHLMDFLKDHETPRQSLSNFDDTPSQDESLASPSPRPHSREAIHSDNSFDPPSSHSSVVPPSTSDNRSIPPRRMRKRATDDDININEAITNVGNCITKWSQPQSTDRHDCFGQNVAHKLRNMSNDQRIFAEKLINEAIFEGELGNLNRYCTIFIPSNTNTHLHTPQPQNLSSFQPRDPILNDSQTGNGGGFPSEDQMINYNTREAEGLQSIGSNISRHTIPQSRNIGNSFQNNSLILNSVPDAESQQSTVGSARNYLLHYVP